VGIATGMRTCGISVGLPESPDCTEDEPHSGTSALQPLVADHAPGNLTLPDTGRPKGSFRCILPADSVPDTGRAEWTIRGAHERPVLTLLLPKTSSVLVKAVVQVGDVAHRCGRWGAHVTGDAVA